MKIVISVATSANHYIDDASSTRLTLSTPEDWAEVYKLRSRCDAILVGGQTLRRDNPSLTLKGAEGIEPMRVIVSGSGAIEPSAKIFATQGGRIVIFSSIERPELANIAEVVVSDCIDVPYIVTELEKRGVESLLVEGGAKILELFLGSRMVDTMRVAVNPTIVVEGDDAPRFDCSEWVRGVEVERENFGAMEVSTYQLRRHRDYPDDEALMERAIEVSQNSPARSSCYRVGAVVKTLDGAIYDGYTLEISPTHHAEQAAITKALAAGADLCGATIYASMEPCSTRSSEPESCSQLILRYGFYRALFALYEPSHFVECHGAENMRRGGVDVCCMRRYAADVVALNRHVLEDK